MRILMLSKACIVGAYQRKLEEMAMIAPDMELIVAVPSSWKDERGVTPLERAYTCGYQLEILPLAFNGQFHLHFYPTFNKLLEKTQPEIVHIDEEPYNLATYHANRLARRSGAKTLWFSWQNLQRAYPPPWSWMEHYNLQNVDYAILGSQTAKKVWQAKGFGGPSAIIPQFGVDPDIFRPPRKPRPTTPVQIAYVGRLVPEKGVDLLLRALSKLPGDWHLTILGKGPQKQHLMTLSRSLNLKSQVTFQTKIPSTAMPDFYRKIDVLVLPSRTQPNWMEQFGRVLIEAMACGTSVIGAESGEIPHVIGDAGLTFSENNVVELREVLSRLIHTPALRHTLSQRGRDRVLKHFTQNRVAQLTVQVYKEMLR